MTLIILNDTKHQGLIGEIIEVSTNHIKRLLVEEAPKMVTLQKDNILECETKIVNTSENPSAISTNAAYKVYDFKYPKHISWAQLSKFVRFTQSIPDVVKEEEIK